MIAASMNNVDESRSPLLRLSEQPSSSTTSSSSSHDLEENDDAADYETAIKLTGYGKFHHLLLLVCGLANASDAIEILCVSFVLPSAECDLKLTDSDKGWLSATVFIGMMAGGYLWGALADTQGRRKTLATSMLVNGLAGLVSSWAGGKGLFFFCRLLSGIGVGGSIPVVWSYFVEFQAKSRRGRVLSALATFWMVGNVSVAALAWISIPSVGWRAFVAMSAVPPLGVAAAVLALPESPKYLLAKGHNRAAVETMAYVYALNTGQPAHTFRVSRLRDGDTGDVCNDNNRGSGGTLGDIWANSKKIFSGRLLLITLTMLYINFSIQFGYYGLWMWFPELFNKLNQYYAAHPNETVSVCQVTDFHPERNDTASCVPDSQVFANSFYISLSALPGNIWTIKQMDVIGRKFFLVLSMILSGTSAFFIYLVRSSSANLAVSCLFGSVSTMGFNALDCLGIELFPTNVRSTAMAITLAVARMGAILGNVVFGYLIEINCAIPILMVAFLLLSGGLVSLRLPNTTNTPLA